MLGWHEDGVRVAQALDHALNTGVEHTLVIDFVGEEEFLMDFVPDTLHFVDTRNIGSAGDYLDHTAAGAGANDEIIEELCSIGASEGLLHTEGSGVGRLQGTEDECGVDGGGITVGAREIGKVEMAIENGGGYGGAGKCNSESGGLTAGDTVAGIERVDIIPEQP